MSQQGMAGVAGVGSTSPAPLGLWPAVRNDRLFMGLIVTLTLLAWLSLWLWQQSPQARFLSHEQIAGTESLGDGYLTVLALFVVGWTVMVVAMMLPTSLPLVAFFSALVRARRRRVVLVSLLIVGYVGVWAAFAGLVHFADLGIHEGVDQVDWLEANAWAISASTFLFAGVYQFTSLKYRCLDKCRSPVAFVMQNWHGRRERWEALRLGAHHGVFCLGCCWSLMLLMFAVGVGNIGWMFALAAVMAVEKNARWGRSLTAPVGAALVVCAAALCVVGVLGNEGG